MDTKLRRESPTQQLADWFWLTILQKPAENRYQDGNYRRLLSESKRMLKDMHMDAEIIKRAILLMIEQAEKPQWMSWCYLKIEPMTQKTWYEVAQDPAALAPPVYEPLHLKAFLTQFDPGNPVLANL